MNMRFSVGLLLALVATPALFTAYLYVSRFGRHTDVSDWLAVFASLAVGAIGVHMLPLRQNIRLGLIAVYVPAMGIGMFGSFFAYRGGL
jgi:hypothetical protein